MSETLLQRAYALLKFDKGDRAQLILDIESAIDVEALNLNRVKAKADPLPKEALPLDPDAEKPVIKDPDPEE